MLVAFILVSIPLLRAAEVDTAQRGAVAVIANSSVEAYAQTVQGIRERLPNVQVWDTQDETQLRARLAAKPLTVAIAVGSGAAAAVGRLAPADLAAINSVVLDCEWGNAGAPLPPFKTAVLVEPPPDVLLGEVARLFPGKTRIGVIRGPMQSESYMRAFERAARKLGMTVEVISCDHPRDLVEAFLALKSRADLVWCPPNAALYNSATLKPLLMASLTNRLPIIGFSEQFVRAGALFGGFADFVEVGRQTAALALRVARNEAVPPRQEARKFRFAYNQRVARILGVRAQDVDPAGADLVVIR